MNENNTKKFMEERKRQAMIQARQMENLAKTHDEQMAKLKEDAIKVRRHTVWSALRYLLFKGQSLFRACLIQVCCYCWKPAYPKDLVTIVSNFVYNFISVEHFCCSQMMADFEQEEQRKKAR